MPAAPDKIPENIDFAVQELLETPAADRSALLENIAKALTKRLLRDNPGIGAREVSERVTAFRACGTGSLPIECRNAEPSNLHYSHRRYRSSVRAKVT